MEYVFVECDPDELLVKKMGFPKKMIIHAGNKPRVCKRLKDNDNCCGLVDEDPYSVQPEYLKNLLNNPRSLITNTNDIKVVYDAKRNNYIIILCPRLEDWFVRTARDSGIRLRDYGLPENPDKLHREINANLDKFEKFLDDILKVNNRRTQELLKAFHHCKEL